MNFAKWNGAARERIQWIDPARCLVEFGFFTDPVDLSNLPAGVRYLNLAWSDLESLAGLECFTELRFLRLPREHAIKSLGATPHLRQLRFRSATGTSITDLSPLNGHPQSRRIEAPCAPIQTLPTTPLPRLQRLVAYCSGCSAQETKRFQQLQPQAYVATLFGKLLVDATSNAKSLRVRSGSTYHPRPTDRILYSTSAPAEITELIGLLRPSERYARPFSIPSRPFTPQLDGRIVAARNSPRGIRSAMHVSVSGVPT